MSNKKSQDLQACGQTRPRYAPCRSHMGCRKRSVGFRICQSSPSFKFGAPTVDGSWSNRSTTTLEAKRWLLSILAKAMKEDPAYTTIHCLKSTPSSWCGKAGLAPDHHVTARSAMKYTTEICLQSRLDIPRLRLVY